MLPKTTEYALRAMAHLSTLPADEGASSAELAAAASIPPHYISKLMRRMVVANLVNSRRGHGGGFTLTRQPDEISFIEILQAVGFLDDTKGCIFGWESCDNEKPCLLHPSWVALRTAFVSWAEKTTLGHVRDDRGVLESVLENPQKNQS